MNGLLIQWVVGYSANVKTVTLPTYFSDTNYFAIGNVTTTLSEEAYSYQIHITSKTENTVTFPTSTRYKRNVFAIGY